MKHFLHILLLILVLVFTKTNLWAGVTYVKVEDINSISDGDTLIIVQETSSHKFRNCFIKPEYINNLDERLEYNSDKNNYATIDEVAAYCHPMRVVNDGKGIVLKDLAINRYLCEYNGSNQSFTTFLWAATEITDKSYLAMEKEGTKLYWKIGGRYLKMHDTIYRYSLRSEKNNSLYLNVSLYKLVRTKDPVEYVLDRSFFSNHYNTLMLPIGIENYQDVFGSGTVVYTIKEISDTEVVFKPLEGTLQLEADTPYIITGTFAAPPYSIGMTAVEMPESPSKNISGLSFNGTYTDRSLSSTDAYVLYEDVFYNCKTIPSLTVSPTKWYITLGDKSVNAPSKICFVK